MSLDLKDAYFQIPVHPSGRKFLRVRWGSQPLQFKTLFFGLSTAPQVFTRVFALVSVWAHKQGIRLTRYLDDWLLLSASEADLKYQGSLLLQFCKDLWITINLEKSKLVPTIRMTYLGMVLDSQLTRAFPSQERLDNLDQVIRPFLAGTPVRAKDWQRLVGHLVSLEKLVPQGRLKLRPIQWNLKDLWSAEESSQKIVLVSPSSLQGHASLVVRQDSHVEGNPVRLHPSRDAALHGRIEGGVGSSSPRGNSRGEMVSGGKDPAHQSSRAHGSTESPGRIRPSPPGELGGTHVRQRHGGGVHKKAGRLKVKGTVRPHGSDPGMVRNEPHSAMNHILLTARFIPGKRNVLADGLSRTGQVVGSEWSLYPQVAQEVLRRWGSPLIDLFATRLNAQLPVFCSPVPDPTPAFEDAFQHSWDGLDVYAFPHFRIIRQVLNRLRQSNSTKMTLVAPWWPEREGFADLQDLATLPSWPLPVREDLLSQPHFRRLHKNPQGLRLHAWRLSSDC
ncbi:uncharacterized protein [Palaemon carinicauda]|uniref:uncharacterized protein n=1 Tax=Palaemon carinicauda TaxID=392227 RepID=UPI0035B5CC5F